MARRKAGRKRLYPMPVEALVDSEDFMAMPAAGAGIVTRLALHYWATGCRPLPVADHELRSIARAHAPTWRHWKASALKIMAEIAPELDAYHRQRTGQRNGLKIASWSALAKGRLNGARLNLPTSPLSSGVLPAPSVANLKARPKPTQHTGETFRDTA